MKQFFLMTLCFLTLQVSAGEHSYEKITIISDLDDTIKITNVGNTTDAIRNGLFSEHFFAGMQELYSGIVPPNKTFFIVSGSIKYLRGRIEEALEENRMPKSEVILKELHDGRTADYKIRKIRGIITNTPGTFILLGDDTEFDPEVLLAMKSEFPDRILATYIRSVRGVKLEAPLVPFLTAYEIAFHEYKAKRLAIPVLMEVEEALVAAREKFVIPPYVSCALLPELKAQMTPKIKERVEAICLKKEKAN